MHRNNILTHSIRVALISSVVAATFTAPVAVAAEDGAKKVERIEVTGSRIKRTDMEAASPVLVMNREELEATGMISIG
ncbi:hypothetical protein ACRN94_18770, partial [Shewanella baltica]